MAASAPGALSKVHVEDRLLGRFPSADRTTVHRLVEAGWHRYDDAPVKAFVPVLVEREVAGALSREQA